jgi:hypothetical protein
MDLGVPWITWMDIDGLSNGSVRGGLGKRSDEGM